MSSQGSAPTAPSNPNTVIPVPSSSLGPDSSDSSSASDGPASPEINFPDRNVWQCIHHGLSRGYGALITNSDHLHYLMPEIDMVRPLAYRTKDSVLLGILWEVCYRFPDDLRVYRQNLREICELEGAVVSAEDLDNLISTETQRQSSLTQKLAMAKVARDLNRHDLERFQHRISLLRDVQRQTGRMGEDLKTTEEEIDTYQHTDERLEREADDLAREHAVCSRKLYQLQAGRNKFQDRLARHDRLVRMNVKLDRDLARTVSDIGAYFDFE